VAIIRDGASHASIASMPYGISPTIRSSCVSPVNRRSRIQSIPGVSDVAVEDHLLRLRVFGPIAPCSGRGPPGCH